MTYLNSEISRIHKDFFLVGGNINSECGESIYGKYFEDEKRIIKHDKPGIIGMCNLGKPHTNGSQYYITFQSLKDFD